MPKQLNKPAYHYENEGSTQQLKRLLREFLDHNRCGPQTLAKVLGCTTKIVNRWITQGPETALLSLYMTKFEEVTGISLDRLMVIDAKREILRKLEDMETVHQQAPDMAFLLARDPELASKIDFDHLPTREAIVQQVRIAAEQCGGPTVARELMLNERYVARWWSEKNRTLPSNDPLERAVILTTIGFVCTSGNGRNDARFRVVALQVLGIPLAEALGIASLEEAMNEVFRGMESDPESVVENKTGLLASTVKRLRKWKPGEEDGRMHSQIQGKLLRLLMARQHPTLMDRYDVAIAAFLDDENHGWAKAPVFLEHLDQTPADPEMANLPAAGEIMEAPQPPPSAELSPTLFVVEPIPVLHRVEFEKALAALKVLLQVHPALIEELPQELKKGTYVKITTEVAPVAVAEPVEEDWFVQMAKGKGVLNAAQIQHLLTLFQLLPKILERLLLAPLAERDRILKQIDPGLVQMQGLLDAAESAEPAMYRSQFLEPQREAGALRPRNG